MPKVSEHRDMHLQRIVRDALAIDPLITLEGIKRVLDKKTGAKGMDINYVRKLTKKVTASMVIVSDREKVEERISQLREKNRIIVDELFRIAFPSPTENPRPDFTDRRKALEAIANIEARQVKLEMDLGLFTRHLGQLDVDHRLKPMDESRLVDVVQTFKVWSTPPQMRRIEPVRTITVQAKETPHEPTKSAAAAATAPSSPISVVTRAGLVPAE